MRRLNLEEIETLADALGMTLDEAWFVEDTFARIYETEQGCKFGWKVKEPLNNVDDYIREWENHWHREYSWKDHYGYELDCGCEVPDTVEEFISQVEGITSYKMPHGDLIIVVC